MYVYSDADRRLIAERVAQFRDQTRRYLAGELSDDQFRPLRLLNGVYFEKHNPMLRVAIPYGQLSARQLRMLARVARVYDRGYGHFTTRGDLQFNWVRIDQVPDILAELAKVDLHSIQGCGNVVRNITTDPLAGVSPEEIADPRPWAEIFRQWATLHPEFQALPRKFKVAFTGGPYDAAGVRFHDLGFEAVQNATGELGFRVWVGGGLGRSPFIGRVLRDFLPWRDLLSYAEAVLRVYNLEGRRDDLYKARIKFLVKKFGIAEFRRRVEAEWGHLAQGPLKLTEDDVARIAGRFTHPDYDVLPRLDTSFEFARRFDKEFAAWVQTNTHAHREPGYLAVTLSLKAPGQAPGDATAEQMEWIADLAERFGFGELRTAQTQNLILPDVRKRDLYNLWQEAKRAGLATPTVGLLTDVVACPGGDYCELAFARTLPVVAAIQERFADRAELEDIGALRVNVSGCVNACGHHHLGAIGLLGVEKAGEERYQVTLGGAGGQRIQHGKVIGPSFAPREVPEVLARLIDHYRAFRQPNESFLDTLERVGRKGFIAAAYGKEIIESGNEREVTNG